MLLAKGGAFGAGGAVVTVSGGTINAFAFMSQATADLWLEIDGTVTRALNFGVRTQLVPATNWVRPVSASPGSYRCRFTNLAGDALNLSSQTENTWRNVSIGDYQWRQIDNSPTFGGQTSTFTVEVDDGSTLQDDGIYQLSADREDF